MIMLMFLHLIVRLSVFVFFCVLVGFVYVLREYVCIRMFVYACVFRKCIFVCM